MEYESCRPSFQSMSYVREGFRRRTYSEDRADDSCMVDPRDPSSYGEHPEDYGKGGSYPYVGGPGVQRPHMAYPQHYNHSMGDPEPQTPSDLANHKWGPSNEEDLESWLEEQSLSSLSTRQSHPDPTPARRIFAFPSGTERSLCNERPVFQQPQERMPRSQSSPFHHESFPNPYRGFERSPSDVRSMSDYAFRNSIPFLDSIPWSYRAKFDPDVLENFDPESEEYRAVVGHTTGFGRRYAEECSSEGDFFPRVARDSGSQYTPAPRWSSDKSYDG